LNVYFGVNTLPVAFISITLPFVNLSSSRKKLASNSKTNDKCYWQETQIR